jgi:hypothetical protein
MQFNFSACALCSISVDEDLELDYREVTAKLLGFFLNSEAAQIFQDQVEAKRLADFNADRSLAKSIFRWSFKRGKYIIVTIENMRFEDLSDAQAMIEKSATLKYEGIG